MQIALREIVDVFQVSESRIQNWIDKKHMPCVKVSEQYRFNYITLLEWALKNKIHLTAELLALGEKKDHHAGVLYQALKNGGIHYDVSGATREEVLKSIVDLLPLPAKVSRGFLYDLMLSREKMMSTAVGNGIALPHVRNPVVLHIQEPIITLCFLKKPVDFKALDGKPVTIVFGLLSPSVKKHLSILARLAFCLQNRQLQEYLHKKVQREQIMAEIRIMESKLSQEERKIKKA